jgi:hypothetical protein
MFRRKKSLTSRWTAATASLTLVVEIPCWRDKATQLRLLPAWFCGDEMVRCCSEQMVVVHCIAPPEARTPEIHCRCASLSIHERAVTADCDFGTKVLWNVGIDQ